MEEEYVTLAQAEELKILGYPQTGEYFYITEDSKILYNWKEGNYDMPSGYYEKRDPTSSEIGTKIKSGLHTTKKFDYNNPEEFYKREYHENRYHNVCICPRLSEVQTWLRKYKNIHICPIKKEDSYHLEINSITELINDDFQNYSYPRKYNSYEHALKDGIYKAIVMIYSTLENNEILEL